MWQLALSFHGASQRTHKITSHNHKYDSDRYYIHLHPARFDARVRSLTLA